MEYNRRTAQWLDRLRSNCKQPHLHHRVLRSVFRSAWRETHFVDATGDRLLKVIREYKCELWWASVKDSSYASRLQAGAVHSRQGTQPCYESLFVKLCGPTWRDNLAACPSYTQWKRTCDELVNEICSQWELPGFAREAAHERKPTWEADVIERKDYLSMLTNPFPEEAHPHDDRWEGTRSCIVFRGDAQAVFNVLNGKASLQDSELQPLFARVVGRIAELIEGGMQPPKESDDPFEWRPRRFNVRADAICNIVLDTSQDIRFQSDDFKTILSMRPHFLVYTDGGTRNNGTSAIGWVIYAVLPDGQSWRYYTLALMGRLLKHNESSFMLESLAIDGATEMLFNLLVNDAFY